MSKKNRTFAVIRIKYKFMTKFLTEVIMFILYVGLFYFITIPIFDFIAPDYSKRFELAWSVSVLLAIFVEKLFEIREELKKINKTDE